MVRKAEPATVIPPGDWKEDATAALVAQTPLTPAEARTFVEAATSLADARHRVELALSLRLRTMAEYRHFIARR